MTCSDHEGWVSAKNRETVNNKFEFLRIDKRTSAVLKKLPALKRVYGNVFMLYSNRAIIVNNR